MSERMNTTEIFDGIRFPGFMHTLESLKAACAFQFQDTDILLVTFPKSGTTWMQQVLSLIFCKGHLWPIHHLPNWARMPWIEQTSFSSLLPKLNSSWPRLLTSHLCAKVLAPALMKSKAKVVYMARNPKDAVVSFYHFHRIAGFLPDPGSFEDFVDEFLQGTGFFGSWFDHVKGWLGLQNDLNLLFVTYEELHQEPRRTIQKLCEFLGHSLRPEEEDVILEHCSFSFMSQSSMVNYSLVSKEIIDQSQGKFLRKGVVGDWREHFTPELDEKFKAVYQSKMGDSGLLLPWTMD
ncbi:sulfotransferase 2B1 [Cricetulus griseus]|uniref:Sulfotransferase n=1 Tax=Cricetulus griseus TaxID=10029 RepID=G3GRR6_CRIGR|nr:sulfotransferase 2B1 [Cricetulus griseus]XP_027266424.1 sulfotransferase 2B1 [Cricetulus griseus]EGV94060.1 Sulfotransferase family cytosolic 2B member 1 [Cricetulus griseus]ERE80614.1 sulfotransferase family cytosolic 2B member 1-like protein [Cricetulus griseus]